MADTTLMTRLAPPETERPPHGRLSGIPSRVLIRRRPYRCRTAHLRGSTQVMSRNRTKFQGTRQTAGGLCTCIARFEHRFRPFAHFPERRGIRAQATGRSGNTRARLGRAVDFGPCIHPGTGRAIIAPAQTPVRGMRRTCLRPARGAEQRCENKADLDEAERDACHDVDPFRTDRITRTRYHAHFALVARARTFVAPGGTEVQSTRCSPRRWRNSIMPVYTPLQDRCGNARGTPAVIRQVARVN